MMKPMFAVSISLLLLVLDGSSAFTVRSRVALLISPPPRRTLESSCLPNSPTQLQGLPNASVLAAAAAASDGASTQLNPLLTFFLETLISNGVPALFTIIVIVFAAKSIGSSVRSANAEKKQRDAAFSPLALLYDDLYGDQVQDSNKQQMLPFFFPKPQPSMPTSLPKNTGIPTQQYLKLTHWNPRLDSYRYSVKAATSGKGMASAEYRRRARDRVFGKLQLSPSQFQQLQRVEQAYLEQASKMETELQILKQTANLMAVSEGMKQLGMNASDPYALDPAAANATAVVLANLTLGTSTIPNLPLYLTVIGKTESALSKLEFGLVQSITTIVGPEQAAVVRAAVFGNLGVATGGSGGQGERPLARLLQDTSSSNHKKKRMFIARFPGDAMASQVENLRQEVTGILLAAEPGDEAMIVVETGGGTVTGYGLAAAQLQRLKNAGIHLTIAVEQVAASGGYMMACLADTIVASPFAILGSIGVVADIPNVYERLKREGIEFQTVTAGKYKRTLTPTKKVTKEDLDKEKEDLEQVYVLFRDFVAKNRPQLNINEIATGEIWFGADALERKLCDELKTVDEIVMERVDSGFDVYEVAYKPPIQSPFGNLFPVPATTAPDMQEDQSVGGWFDSAVRWLVRRVVTSVSNELNPPTPSVEQRYLAKDDTADRINIKG